MSEAAVDKSGVIYIVVASLMDPAEKTAHSPGAVLPYRSRVGSRGTEGSSNSIIVIPQRIMLPVLLGFGCLMIGVSFGFDTYETPFPRFRYGMSEVMLRALFIPDDRARNLVISAGCISAVVLAIGFSIRRHGWPLLSRVLLAAIPFVVWSAQLGVSHGTTFLTGFYLAAVGCTIVSLSILLTSGSSAEAARRIQWCIPIRPLRRFELPIIHRHLDGPQECCDEEWTQTQEHRRWASRSHWSAAIVLVLGSAPFAIAKYGDELFGMNSESAGWAGFGLLLIAVPAVWIFGLIGLVCGSVALITPPRKIATVIATLVCFVALAMSRFWR